MGRAVIVCLVCDSEKLRAKNAKEPSDCSRCGRVTASRMVGDPEVPIYPGSCVTFGMQQVFYLSERHTGVKHRISG